MKNLTFYRTKYSGYFPSNFKEIEEKTLLSLGITPSDNEGGAQILITNTDTYLDQPFSDDVKLIIHPNSGYDNFSKKFIENCPPRLFSAMKLAPCCGKLLFESNNSTLYP